MSQRANLGLNALMDEVLTLILQQVALDLRNEAIAVRSDPTKLFLNKLLMLRTVNQRFNSMMLDVFFSLAASVKREDFFPDRENVLNESYVDTMNLVLNAKNWLLDILANPSYSAPAYPNAKTMYKVMSAEYFGERRGWEHRDLDRINAMQIAARGQKPLVVDDRHVEKLLHISNQSVLAYELKKLKYAFSDHQIEKILAHLFANPNTVIYAEFLASIADKLTLDYFTPIFGTMLYHVERKTELIKIIQRHNEKTKRNFIVALFTELSIKMNPRAFPIFSDAIEKDGHKIDMSTLINKLKNLKLKDAEQSMLRGYFEFFMMEVLLKLLQSDKKKEFGADFLAWFANLAPQLLGRMHPHCFSMLVEEINPEIFQEILLSLPESIAPEKRIKFFGDFISSSKKPVFTESFVNRVQQMAINFILNEAPGNCDSRLLLDLLGNMPSSSLPPVITVLGEAKTHNPQRFATTIRRMAQTLLEALLTSNKCSEEQLRDAGLDDEVSISSMVFSGWNMTLFGARDNAAVEESAVQELKPTQRRSDLT